MGKLETLRTELEKARKELNDKGYHYIPGESEIMEIKPFEINLENKNSESETEKTKINSSSLSKYNETNTNPITKETLKNNLKKFINQ